MSQLNSWTGSQPSCSEIDAVFVGSQASCSEIDAVFVRVCACSCTLADELVGDGSVRHCKLVCHCKLGSEGVLLSQYTVLPVVGRVWQGENPDSDQLN